MKNNYLKFLLMLVSSFIIMHVVMFFNVATIDHVYLSMQRVYMTLLMVSPMALLMLAFMGKMYPNKKLNIFISLLSVAVFALSFYFLRNQVLINDEQFMRAMIPHHSSAILPSKAAGLENPELRKLAEEIIIAQEKEIAQMKEMLGR